MRFNEIVNTVYDSLEESEGKEGDTTGAAETGKIGVTQMARDAVGNPNIDDREIAKLYLIDIGAKLQGLEGYAEAPDGVQVALLDTMYNTGDQLLGWKGMAEGLKGGDYEKAMKNILDTAQVEGKSMKGLAKRRAKAYNIAFPSSISSVLQQLDGTIKYNNKAGDTLFEYRVPRHEKSEAGVITLN